MIIHLKHDFDIQYDDTELLSRELIKEIMKIVFFSHVKRREADEY